MWCTLCARVILLKAVDDDILMSLTELEETLRDLTQVDRTDSRAQRCGNHQECVYYLITYGTHLSLISFYLRHDCLKDALTYLLSKVTHTRLSITLTLKPASQNAGILRCESQLRAHEESLVFLEDFLSLHLHLVLVLRSVQKRCFWRAFYSRVWNEADWGSCRGSWRLWTLRWRAGADT